MLLQIPRVSRQQAKSLVAQSPLSYVVRRNAKNKIVLTVPTRDGGFAHLDVQHNVGRNSLTILRPKKSILAQGQLEKLFEKPINAAEFERALKHHMTAQTPYTWESLDHGLKSFDSIAVSAESAASRPAKPMAENLTKPRAGQLEHQPRAAGSAKSQLPMPPELIADMMIEMPTASVLSMTGVNSLTRAVALRELGLRYAATAHPHRDLIYSGGSIDPAALVQFYQEVCLMQQSADALGIDIPASGPRYITYVWRAVYSATGGLRDGEPELYEAAAALLAFAPEKAEHTDEDLVRVARLQIRAKAPRQAVAAFDALASRIAERSALREPALIDRAQDKSSLQALFTDAAENDVGEVISYMINKGADVSLSEALSSAVEAGALNAVRLLLQAGGQIEEHALVRIETRVRYIQSFIDGPDALRGVQPLTLRDMQLMKKYARSLEAVGRVRAYRRDPGRTPR